MTELATPFILAWAFINVLGGCSSEPREQTNVAGDPSVVSASSMGSAATTGSGGVAPGTATTMTTTSDGGIVSSSSTGGTSSTLAGSTTSSALGPTPIEELIAAYEASEITLDQFTAASLDALATPVPQQLPTTLEGVALLRASDSPYVAAANLSVGGVLVLQPGTTLRLGQDVTLEVAGQLYALGTPEQQVSIVGADAAQAFASVRLLGARSELHFSVLRHGHVLLDVVGTGQARIEIDNCWLDSWVGDAPNAVSFEDADGLWLHDSQIGTDTPEGEMQGEGLHGVESAALIEHNVFGERVGYADVLDLGPCSSDHMPRVIGNVFLGGQDDAVDMDDCMGIVAGNRIGGFTGEGSGSQDGGALTGGGSSEVLVVNNIIDSCVHAIGYKGEARAWLLHNTIVNSDEGFRPLDDAQVEAIGNVFSNNGVDMSGDVPGYLTASFNLFDIPGYSGSDGNLATDPLFAEVGGNAYGLSASSPALGLSQVDIAALASRTPFSQELLERLLSVDILGRPRHFPMLDAGAISSGGAP